ncbi:MAG: hypothetical protein P4L83_25190 [Nevskia sp.]|nr:hypothetical protein [Nevskia sp.]
MKKTIIAALALGLAPAVFADDSAAGGMVDSLAPPACKKPMLPNTIRRADDDSEFVAKYDAYAQCIKDYIATQQALSQKHIDAANAAVTDANAFRDKVNEARANNAK